MARVLSRAPGGALQVGEDMPPPLPQVAINAPVEEPPAPAIVPGGRIFTREPGQPIAVQAAPDNTWSLRHGLELAAGVGLPMAAGVVGGPGLAALTSMGVEAGRQYLEGEPFNPQAMGVEGALALIPGGGAAESALGNIGKRAVHGALLGTAGEVPRELARSGQYPSVEQALSAGAFGGVVGGAVGGGEHLYGRIIAKRPGATPEIVTPPPQPQAPPPAEVAPPPLAETYGPAAPRTTGGQGELFTPLTEQPAIGRPIAPQPAPMPQAPPEVAPAPQPAPQPAPTIVDLRGMGTAISDNLYRSMLDSVARKGTLPPQERNSSLGRAFEQYRNQGLEPIQALDRAFVDLRGGPGPAPAVRSQADLAASPEAISRLQAERLQGIGYFRTRQRGGALEPLPATVDRVDIQPRGDEVILKQDANGALTVDRTGPDVQPQRLPAVLQRAERQLPKAPLPAAEAPPAAPPPEAAAPPRQPIQGPIGQPVQVFGLHDPRITYEHQFRAVPLDAIQTDVEGIQPRDVGRAAREANIRDLANKLSTPGGRARYFAGNQEMDRGVPIVDPEARALSGNTRLKAIQLLRAENPEAYRAFLADQQAHAAQFGLRPEDLAGDTVAVRELTQPMTEEQLRTFADEANGRASMAMAPVETATMDADRIQAEDVRNLQIAPSETVDAALNSPKNAGVVQRFISTFPSNERNSISTREGSRLNPEGLTRLKAALVAKTYNGEAGQRLVEALTESTDTGIKNLESGVFGSIAKMGSAMDVARSGSLQSKDLDIAEDIAKSLEYIAQKRAAGTLPGQMPAFGTGLTPFQETLADHLEAMSKSAVRVRRLVNSMADVILESPRTGQQGLLGPMAPMTKEAVLQNALTRANEEGLFGDVGAIGRRPRRPTGRPGEKPGIGGEQPQEEKPRGKSLAEMGLGGAGHGPVPEPPIGVVRNPAAQQGRLSAENPDLLAKSTRIQTPEDAQRIQDELALHIRNEIEYARRGKVTEAETRAAADRIGINVEGLLARKRGQAFNDAQVLAADRANKYQQLQFRRAWEAAYKNPTDQTRLEMAQELFRLAGTAEQFAGATAEAGRALHTYRMLANDPFAQAVRKAYERFGGSDTIDQIVADLMKFDPNDQGAINRYAKAVTKVTTFDKLRELFINSLVSGPQSQVVNTVSNTATAAERPAMVPFKVAADIIRSRVTGTPRERFMGEMTADIYGMLQGFRGIRGAFQEAASETSKVEGARKHAIGGRLGEVVRWPTRWLELMDNVAKAINGQGYLHARAYRQAMQEGRTGEALWKRVAEIVSRPEAIEGLPEAVKHEQRYRTFQDDTPFTRAVVQFRDKIPYGIGHFIMPFVRTPLRIASFGIERSPLALIDILHRVGQGNLRGAELSDKLAQMAVGTAAAGFMASLVNQDLVTGFGPADPYKRAAWRATHQPYSFKIPKIVADQLGLKSQWINYGRIEPFGMILGLGADVGELLDKTEAEDAVAKVGFAFGKNLSSKTFLKGLSGFMNAVDDPENYARQFINDFAGAAVPQLVSQLTRSVDPVLRKPRTIAETLQTRLGLGAGSAALGLDEVGSVRDIFGQEVIRVGGPAERALSPIYRSYTREEDPARAETSRLQLAVGSPQRQLAGVELNTREYDTYVRDSGELAHRMATRLVTSGGYLRMDDEDKAAALHKVFLEARQVEREKLKGQVLRRARSLGIQPKQRRAG